MKSISMDKRLNEREKQSERKRETERASERFKKSRKDKRLPKYGRGEAKADSNEEGVSEGDLN